MTRSALPQNFILDEGTIFDTFESGAYTAQWTRGSGTGTMEFGTTHVLAGTRSLKVSALGTGATSLYRLFDSPLVNGEFAHDSMVFPVYVEDVTKLKGYGSVSNGLPIEFRLYGNAGTTVYFHMYWYAGDLINGWNYITIHTGDWTRAAAVGDMTWAHPIYGIGMMFYGNAAGDNTALYFDQFRYGVRHMPSIVLTFDDNYASEYDVAWPIMQAAGVRGTFFINSAYIGASDTFFSLEECQTLYAAGNQISPHGERHYNNSEISLAEQRTNVQNCINYLVENDMPDGIEYYASPFDVWDANTHTVLAECGIVAARDLPHFSSGLNGYTRTPLANMYCTSTKAVASTTTLAAAQAITDYVVANKTTVFLMVHGVDEAADFPLLPNSWHADYFSEWLDYSLARGVRFLTFKEWEKGLTNPRYRSLPVGRS